MSEVLLKLAIATAAYGLGVFIAYGIGLRARGRRG